MAELIGLTVIHLVILAFGGWLPAVVLGAVYHRSRRRVLDDVMTELMAFGTWGVAIMSAYLCVWR